MQKNRDYCKKIGTIAKYHSTSLLLEEKVSALLTDEVFYKE
jgi:hypothetical protein